MEPARDRALQPSEQLHAGSAELHRCTSSEVLALFEAEAHTVTDALLDAREAIIQLGEAMAVALARGGRVLYLGAGTSGRIGALDAAEWPPTFGIAPDRIVACMAGGAGAFATAVEGAEDDADAARVDLDELRVTREDLIVGISASGAAAYVREALAYAAELEAARAFITSHPTIGGDDQECIVVRLDTGSEVLAGSTRLKAATATHQVLQRASNICAVKSGWIYAGRMVEMRPTNQKLRARAERIVSELAEVPIERAAAQLAACGDDIKCALVALRLDLEPAAARERLDAVGRRLSELPGF